MKKSAISTIILLVLIIIVIAFLVMNSGKTENSAQSFSNPSPTPAQDSQGNYQQRIQNFYHGDSNNY